MSHIYLIDLSAMRLVGKFATVTDAELAGELLLGTSPYYVGGSDDLERYTKAELLALLISVGKEIPESKIKYTNKGEMLAMLVAIADQTDFAPVEPPKPAKPAKPAKQEKAPRATGIKAQIRAALEQGLTVALSDFEGATKVSFQTAISDLRSPKYCGKDLEPLVIIREGEKFHL